MVERSIQASERGAALTHRLLAFSRKQTLMPTTINLSKLAECMTEMLRPTAFLTKQLNFDIPGCAWKMQQSLSIARRYPAAISRQEKICE
jgi:hypothetical protein